MEEDRSQDEENEWFLREFKQKKSVGMEPRKVEGFEELDEFAFKPKSRLIH